MTADSERFTERPRAWLAPRKAELALLSSLLEPNGPAVIHIGGVAGIGKSTLVEEFIARARATGATVLAIDCGAVEPSQPGLLEALARASGATQPSLDAILARLAQIDGPVLIAFDAYERFWLMDAFVRLELAPALPASVRIVMAGRDGPVAAWLTSPAWSGRFKAILLPPLTNRDAVRTLCERGLDATTARRINNVARGNPLALSLAAGAVLAGSPALVEDSATSAVIDTVAEQYLAHATDPATREVLEAASVIRRTTESLLRVMLPGVAPGDAIERLRALPFVTVASDGLAVHDAVRDAVATRLRTEDPERFRRYRVAAWHQLKSEVQSAPASVLWRYTADILYFLQKPEVREGFFPTGHQQLAVESASPSHEKVIFEIASRHEGHDGQEIIASWWKHLPGAFRVCIDSMGQVSGFAIATTSDHLPEDIITADPIIASWKSNLPARVRPNQAIFIRRLLDGEEGEAASPSRGAFGLDVKRAYMEMRPSLRYVYLGGNDPRQFDWCDPLGFQEQESILADIDEKPFHTFRLDMGSGSVDAWLQGLVAVELGIDEADTGSLVDLVGHELQTASGRVPLSPLEYGVVSLLAARGGKPVSRADLVEHAWGYRGDATSNVVEAVILSLRKKLGPEAYRLETVRGVGYRLR